MTPGRRSDGPPRPLAPCLGRRQALIVFAGVAAALAGCGSAPRPATGPPPDQGAAAGGGADDTAALNAAIANVPAGGEVTVPTGTYRISGPLVVPRSVRLRADGYVEIQQSAFPKPVFDVLDVDDVSIDGFDLTYVGAPRTGKDGPPFFRGDPLHLYAAGVWANGSRITVSNCRARGFTIGYYLSAWNSRSGGITGGGRTNRIADVECSAVDFGVLFLGQSDIRIERVVAQDIVLTAGSHAPPHAVYGSGNRTLLNHDVVIDDVRCDGSPLGHAVQLKYTVGGSVDEVTASNCAGLFNGIDLTRVAFRHHQGTDLSYGQGPAWSLQEITTNSSCALSDITLGMTGPGTEPAVSIAGDDIVIAGMTITASRPDLSVNTFWECRLRGDRLRVDGLRIEEQGPGQPRGIDVGDGRSTKDGTLAGIACRGTQNLIDVEAMAANLVIRYDPAAQVEIVSPPRSWVAVGSGTPTYAVVST